MKERSLYAAWNIICQNNYVGSLQFVFRVPLEAKESEQEVELYLVYHFGVHTLASSFSIYLSNTNGLAVINKLVHNGHQALFSPPLRVGTKQVYLNSQFASHAIHPSLHACTSTQDWATTLVIASIQWPLQCNVSVATTCSYQRRRGEGGVTPIDLTYSHSCDRRSNLWPGSSTIDCADFWPFTIDCTYIATLRLCHYALRMTQLLTEFQWHFWDCWLHF